MQSYDDDEFEGSQDNGSDDDQNQDQEQDQIEDDADQDENDDGDGDDGGEEEEDDGDEDGDGDGDEDQDEDDGNEGGSQADGTSKRSVSQGTAPRSLGVTPVLAPPEEQSLSNDHSAEKDDKPKALLFPPIRPEALTALDYDIVPTIAAPQSTSVNVVTATPDMRWVFSGGSDGYIRKFNWIDTANNKIALTVAQRQHLVDTISKAGVLTSYWENEDPASKSTELGSNLSPVYSLAVHSRALWLLSGCESGTINLQSIRHDEGKTQHRLKQHTSAVSVLSLAQDEKSVLSGSWDKTVIDWDLNTGSVKRKFEGSTGQISSLEMRPLSSIPVPEIADLVVPSTTMSSDNADKPRPNDAEVNNKFTATNGITSELEIGAPSPADSLFGGQDNDSLFGGGDDSNEAQLFGDDNDFSRAIASGAPPDNDADALAEVDMSEPTELEPVQAPETSANTLAEDSKEEKAEPEEVEPAASGLPHAEDIEMKDADDNLTTSPADQPVADTVFMTSSFDGAIRIWDKRRPDAVARIAPKNVPPWCMGACWSPDGNYIYAGRRNGTVEEYSLHKGLRGVERTFRFPNGSGPVSAVRALPNGRHLICASYDTLRLYDLKEQQAASKPQFLVVSGHRTGIISQLYIDPSCRFMISTAGNRGWEGTSTQLLLGYEINIEGSSGV